MKLITGFLILVFFFSDAAVAQESLQEFPPLTWDGDVVDMIASMARKELLPKAHLRDGKLVGIESEAEWKKPLLPKRFIKTVVNHSVFWNTVHWCKFSLKNADFDELMDKEKWNEKQLAYIAVLHGATTRFVNEQLHSKGTCSEEFKYFIKNKYSEIL